LKGLVGVLEPRLVFFPFSGENATPAPHGLPYERVEIATADGERLVAWRLVPETPVADVVYFKGNGGNLSVWLPVLATLYRLDVQVLAVDYRGYGLSTGTPSEEGVYRDAEAVVEYAARLRGDDPAAPLVYWGRSLGGPVAAAAARAVRPDGLILESTFPDKVAVIRFNPVLRFLNLFASYRFSTVDLLQGFPGPVLVMHGDRDRIIPYRLGRELYEAIEVPKRFVAIQGADHNDFFDTGELSYWGPPLEFMTALRDR
jgi:uncharacterized protein